MYAPSVELASISADLVLQPAEVTARRTPCRLRSLELPPPRLGSLDPLWSRWRSVRRVAGAAPLCPGDRRSDRSHLMHADPAFHRMAAVL